MFYYEFNILRSNGSGTVASFSARVEQLRKLSTARVLASQAEAIVRTGKRGHYIE